MIYFDVFIIEVDLNAVDLRKTTLKSSCYVTFY